MPLVRLPGWSHQGFWLKRRRHREERRLFSVSDLRQLGPDHAYVIGHFALDCDAAHGGAASGSTTLVFSGRTQAGASSQTIADAGIPNSEKATAQTGPPPIGAAIRDRRRRLGMTLQALADACELSVPFLSQVERDLAIPSLVLLTSIASALGVDMSYFVGTPPPGQIVRHGDDPEHLHFDTGPVA